MTFSRKQCRNWYKNAIFAENKAMMKFRIRFFLLGIALFASYMVKAQVFSNDFENRNEWNSPWLNLHIVADSTATTENFICICDTIHEYGFGFGINADKNFPNQNVSCRFGFQFKADSDTQADIVVSIDDTIRNRYWAAYPIANYLNDTMEWSQVQLDLNFPASYTQGSEIKIYVWNKAKEFMVFDDAQLEIKTDVLPSYQPEIDRYKNGNEKPYNLSPGQDSLFIMLQYYGYWSNLKPVVEYINADGDTISNPSIAETDIQVEILWDHSYTPKNRWDSQRAIGRRIITETRFKEDVKLLRLAFVLPLPEGEITVYRRNQHIDSLNLQSSYYLDREGFTIKYDNICFSTFHNTGISSLQLNTDNRYACFNIDYWRDHPLLHYPMRADISDYFEDISYRNVKAGEVLTGYIDFYNYYFPDELPRIMPVWDGYQSAFIFTEHADWTDLRTHRAVLFGNENITKPEDAVGGFCYFNIPVTKSVFYWNPDNVTNEKTSGGRFTGLCASIQTDKEFYKLLKTLKKEGFEICLHSPEIYTTIPSEFPTAMRFMRRNFNTVSWIDHGYNNGPDKNREDLVCDGLLPDSPQYAAELWKKNGVRYLWNAYYEENRMESHNFDGHFVQPFDGFGDALPNRQITTLPNGDKDFLLWSTPSTLEVNEDHEWYYYFDSIRLQRLVDQHNVFITHVYPAWSNSWRAFWQYNENGTAVAMPGFNFALSQLAHFRDEKKILPTTIEQYLSYYEKLQNVEYLILDSKTIQLNNRGEAIKGMTLLCTKPIVVEGKAIDFRKVDEGYLVWFNIDKNETVTIRYRE